MKVKLKILVSGVLQEHNLEVNKSISLGRSSKNDITINDEKVSSQHCRLVLKPTRLELNDDDSKSGTYLNGIRVEQSEVFLGDEVKIGDTKITIDDKSIDQDAIYVLTFPGPSKDRISSQLKADFTGARNQNQSARPSSPTENSHLQEVNLRKKIKSRIKLSKEEIRNNNKGLSAVAFILDAVVMVILSAVVFYVSKIYIQEYSLIALAAVIILYLAVNFKFSKFTFGEAVTGIRKKYLEQ